MKPTDKKSPDYTTVRIKKELMQEVQKHAAAENRSANNYIVAAVKDKVNKSRRIAGMERAGAQHTMMQSNTPGVETR
jgi:predicted transcriptional regulator